MSWVKISDTPTGLALEFSEYKNGGWVYTPIASGLDRTQVHTLKLTMQFVDGPANDIVNVFVDGELEHDRHQLGGVLPHRRGQADADGRLAALPHGRCSG